MKAELVNNPVQLSSGDIADDSLLLSKKWKDLQSLESIKLPQSFLTTLSIVRNSGIPMILFWGPELTCYYNDVYEPLLDESGKTGILFGKKIKDFPHQKLHFTKSNLELILSGQSFISEDRIIQTHTNTQTHWTLNYISVNDDFGKTGGVLVICNKKKVDNEEYYLEILQDLPVAIYTCDADGFIKFYNQAAGNLWGSEPVPGKSMWCGSWKIFHPDGTQMPVDKCPMAIAIKEGRIVSNQEIIVERPDGVRLHIMPHPQPIHDKAGVLIGAVNMLVDITKAKSIENEIRQTENKIRNELKIEIGDRTKELNQLNEDLKKSNSELSQFAYVASHDLQEPLRKIQTFVTRIVQKDLQNLSESGKDYFERMKYAANRMQTLIDDLLAYSRTNTAEKIFELTDLNNLLKDVKTELESNIQEKKATINFGPLPELKIIRFQFFQLFTNLLSNSLKFSRQDILPVINISSDFIQGKNMKIIGPDPNQNYCRLIVSDNGIGFEPEFNLRIFELFQRLHGKSEYSGTGIGLAICKKIAENHGGFISAESQSGNGATFYIYLPV